MMADAFENGVWQMTRSEKFGCACSSFLIVGLGIAGSIWLIKSSSDGPPATDPPPSDYSRAVERDTAAMLRRRAKALVLVELEEPGSVQIVDEEANARRTEEGSYIVTGAVDYQDAFGALLRATFSVQFSQDAWGNWNYDGLEVRQR
jgi:hypothetical protein